MSNQELSNILNNDSNHHLPENETNNDPFTLIEKGNSLESSKNQWGSSYYYSKAYSVLLQEYQSIMMTIINTNVNNKNDNYNSNDDDKITSKKKKIAALYHDQSIEYLHKARQSLIGALMFEREEDLKRWGDVEPMVDSVHYNHDNSNKKKNGSNSCFDGAFDPMMTVLTREEMERRIDTFRRLFVSQWKEENSINSNRDCVVKEKDVHDIEVQTEPILIEDFTNNNNNKNECNMTVEDEHEGTTSVDDRVTTSLEERLAMLVPITNASSNDENFNNNSSNCDDKNQTDDDHNVELTLEQRLANLNSSIKTNTKTLSQSDDERLNYIRSSLDNLGVYLPSSSHDNAKNILLDEHSLTDEEQFHLIMNMAKDEAALEKQQNSQGDDNDDNEDVEELLKRSGIRIDLPLDHSDDYNDEMLVANNDKNEDIQFSSITSLKKAGLIPNDVDNDSEGERDNNDDEIVTLEDMKRVLCKSQQMLLQASVCLDECENTDNLLLFNRRINKRNVKEEKDDIVNDYDNPAIAENEETLETKDDCNNDEDVQVIDECNQNNKGNNCSKETQNEADSDFYKEGEHDATNGSDDIDHKLLDAHSKEDDIIIKKVAANMIPKQKYESETEQERIRSLGRESLVKAKLYLERLLEGWPDAEVN